MNATAAVDRHAPIAIVGLGARCAVGLSAAAVAAAVRAGISGLAEHPYMVDKVGRPMVVAAEPTLDPALDGPGRWSRLAAPALAEARAVLDAVDAGSVPVFIAVPGARAGVPAGVPDALAAVVPRGDRLALVPGGHAAGLAAVAQALAWLVAHPAGFCLAGGVDSYLTADALESLDAAGLLKSSANRNGFPPGEAAGFCLLATDATARAHGLPVLAWIESLASAVEPSPIRSTGICVGRGLTQAIEGALAPLRLPEERIDDAICDLNGEPYRSEEFALTVLRTQTLFVDATRFWTPTDCWGDVGAASVPLYMGLAAAAGLRGYAKGPRTLVWASSEDGARAAAVLRLPRADAGVRP